MNSRFLFILFMTFWAHQGIKVATYAITLDMPSFFNSALYMLMYAYFIQRFMISKKDKA